MKTAAMALLLLAGVGSTQGQVFVVDASGGPGSDFTDLQPAVDAAASGDVLLVRDGAYGSIAVVSKALAIVAEEGARPSVGSLLGFPATVQFTPHGVPTLLRGLRFSGLLLQGCQGPVWLEDCVFESANGGIPPLSTTDCLEVVVQRGSLVGRAGSFCDGFCNFGPTAALDASTTELYLEGCALTGGAGDDALPAFGAAAQAGAPALRIQGGSLWASDAALAGGAGGTGGGDAFQCFDGGDGGAGIEASGTPLLLRATSASGGAGGPAGSCAGSTAGADGAAEDLSGGATSTAVPGPAPSLAASAPVRELATLTLALEGPPGDLAVLAFSLAPRSTPLLFPAVTGALHLAPPLPATLVAGTVPPGGVLLLPVPIGLLPAGLEGLPLWLQAATCGTTCALSSASATVFLSSGI